MPIINYKEILELKYKLTPSQLSVLDIPNKNKILVKDLLDRELKPSDKGNEVGSQNYVYKSNYYFIRAKALQKDYFLPLLNNESVVAIHPQVFKNFNLKEDDLIISKDSNIGEAIVLDKDYPNFIISGALYKLPITKNKLYFFAFLKHHYFRKQLSLMTPKGSTIRHAKTLFLKCEIPFPNQRNSNDVVSYIELLVQALINKEKEIKRKNQFVFELIEKELLENQKEIKFKFENPKFSELLQSSRLDASYHCYDYKWKKFLIFNYKSGGESIDKWGFEMKRGQNLQVSQIGKSIYSNEPKENFYTLMEPANFSEFGTVKKFEYIGNPKILSFLKVGDIVLSATGTIGRTIGKCFFFYEEKGKWFTNINAIVLRKENYNNIESAFISCFLRFLRHYKVLDYISVGGKWGSLAQKYWKDILIPNFPKLKQQEIASLYHNPIDYQTSLNLENFLEKDQMWNEKAGIIEIDKSIKKIKEHLNKTLDKIVNDEEVKIDFSFLT